MGMYKMEQTRPEVSHIANNVNFHAGILRASDWLKNNQLLSQLTHAYYRDTVLLTLQAWSVKPCKNQKKATCFKNSPLIKVH